MLFLRARQIAIGPFFYKAWLAGSADTTVQLWQIPDLHKEDGSSAAQIHCVQTLQVHGLCMHNTSCQSQLTVQSMQGHPEEVYACEFVEQTHLLSASADSLFLWNTETNTCLQKASGMPSPLHQGKLHVVDNLAVSKRRFACPLSCNN